MYAIAYDWLDEGTLKQIEAEREGVKPAWWESLNPGVNAFDKRKPLFDTEGEALRVLDNVQTHDGIGPNADRALFWLGYVHYYRGRFDEADHYFSQLVELHKDSKLRDQAMELAIVSKHNATGGAVYDSGKASEALNLIHQAQATIPEFTKDPEKRAMMERQKVAVRMQLATKYVEYGRYYERTGHPGSAYFYYDLVRRQHPGTKPADYAAGRMAALEPLRAKAEADRAAGIKRVGQRRLRQARLRRGGPVRAARGAGAVGRPEGPAGLRHRPAVTRHRHRVTRRCHRRFPADRALTPAG
jgi:outer membrane protein assembly factor BamD (BamD/ComL family)